MTEDLRALEDWAGALLAKFEPAERRKLTRSVALDLRRSQQKRITEQRNPDGTAYEPRKPQKNLRGKIGRIKRKMFTKLKLAKNLKAQNDDSMAGVAFVKRVSRIAKVHHYGERDKVDNDGPTVRYAERKLVGFSPGDRELIRDRLLHYLNG